MQGSRAKIVALTLGFISAFAPHSSSAEGESALDGTPLLTPLTIEGNGSQLVTVLDIGNGVGVFEGDVLVPIAPGVSSRSFSVEAQSFSVTMGGSLWPDGVMPYTFDSGLSNTAKAKILDAIDHWNASTPVQVVPRNGETDYVNFIDENGCASYIGRIGGEQPVYSSPNCSVGNFIHEIGHALGLYHEHTRPDRDSFVTINWSNIDPNRSQNFDVVNSNSQVNTPYDYGSIMHYGEHFFSINSLQTITPLQSNANIGQRVALSNDDITGVNALYSAGFNVDFDLTPERPMPNSDINATFALSNTTGSSVQSIDVSTILPTGVVFQNATGSAWSCSSSGQALDCTGPTLQNAGTTSLEISMMAPNSVAELAFNFNVSATATGGSEISLDSLANRTMTAVNDPPQVEVPLQSPVALIPFTGTSAALTRVDATDPNGHTLRAYTITSESHPGLLALDPDNGDIFVTDADELNSLENETISLGVTVSDGIESADETFITIDVLTSAGLSQSTSAGGGAFMSFWLLLALPLRRLRTATV